MSSIARKRRTGWALVVLAASMGGCGGGDQGGASVGAQQGEMPPLAPSANTGVEPSTGTPVATDSTATDSMGSNAAATDSPAAGGTPVPSAGQNATGTETPTTPPDTQGPMNMGDDSTPAATPDPTQGGGVAPADPGGSGDVVGFAEIQLDLENAGGARGAYTSCTQAPSCHQNPARNVIILANPTPEQLLQNWQNIVQVPDGVTPWVLPADDSAQMLNEVAVTADVRARWLAWIEAGAPFDAP